METINYTQVEAGKFAPGQAEFINDVMGRVTYVGLSKQGDVVVQQGDSITALPELEFNLHGFREPERPQVFFFTLSKHEVDQLSTKSEPLVQLSALDNELADYKVRLTVVRNEENAFSED